MKTPTLGENRQSFLACDLEIWRMTLKIVGHVCYVSWSVLYHVITIGGFQLELQSGNGQFGSIFGDICPLWPWNLTDDLDKQNDASPMLRKSLCIISSPYVDSNSNYGPETTKILNWVWPLYPWPLTSDIDLQPMVITPENSMLMQRKEHSEKVWHTDRQTDRRTIHRALGRS